MANWANVYNSIVLKETKKLHNIYYTKSYYHKLNKPFWSMQLYALH